MRTCRDTSIRTRLSIILLLTMSLATIYGTVEIARADVPSVLQVENLSQDSAGKIELQIRHLNPSSAHYVDSIEVSVSGQTKKFSLDTQNSNPFTVESNLGQIEENSVVRIRAHCTIHGWSDWSSEIRVPEFSDVGMVVLLALTFVLLMAKKSRNQLRP